MPIEPGNLSLGVLAGGLIGTIAGHYLTKSRSMEERRVSAAYILTTLPHNMSLCQFERI
jgi:hypothetical protein